MTQTDGSPPPLIQPCLFSSLHLKHQVETQGGKIQLKLEMPFEIFASLCTYWELSGSDRGLKGEQHS